MKPNTAKSLALVAFAVLIGLGILSAGYDDVTVAFSDSDGQVAAEAEDTATPTPEIVEDTLTAASAVSVLVANATGVEGLARLLSDDLGTGSGYTMLPATNALEGVNGLTTSVYYASGTEADARGVAVALELDPNIVAPLPLQSPVADATGAHVVVVAGDDVAPTS